MAADKVTSAEEAAQYGHVIFSAHSELRAEDRGRPAVTGVIVAVDPVV